MTESDWNRINTMLVECATALMTAFGTSVVHDPLGERCSSPQDGVLAIIGFGGDQVRGSLVVSASPGLLHASCPVPRADGESSPETLQDWAGELANQLLGRFKSRLLAHRITILLGTPTTVSGLDLRVRSQSANLPSMPQYFSSGQEWLIVRLDALVAPGVSLLHGPDPAGAASEGDILFF